MLPNLSGSGMTREMAFVHVTGIDKKTQYVKMLENPMSLPPIDRVTTPTKGRDIAIEGICSFSTSMDTAPVQLKNFIFGFE
jgi:hypothetical protein